MCEIDTDTMKEKQRERRNVKRIKMKKKIDLFSESLLMRVDNLTVPPSHAAEALASPKRNSGTTVAEEPTTSAPLSIWPNEFACQ